VLAESAATGTSTVTAPPSAVNAAPPSLGVNVTRKRAAPAPVAVNTPVTGSMAARSGVADA
jgi:hypothetical protein